jgi:tetratricopeptide (TPR) repeat protein
MKTTVSSLVVLCLFLIASPAAAADAQPNDTQQRIAVCQSQVGGAKAVSPDQKIGACTVLLEKGGFSARQLSLLHVLRSDGYAAQKDVDREMADLDEAVQADPAYAYAWAQSCSAHHWTSHDLERANKECTTALTLDPKSDAAWTYRGDLYLDQASYDLAIGDYDHAIAINPTWMWPWDNRGEAYLRSGRMDQAIQNFEQVIKLSPDYAMGYLDRGIARIKLNQLDLARVDFEQGLKVDVHCAPCIYGRGVVKRMAGDPSGGASDIAVAKAMNPKASANFDSDGVKAP